MPYAIIRIEKLKKSSLGGSGSHVARSRPTPNADMSKQADNTTLIHNNDRELPLGFVVAAKIASSHKKRKIRSDAVHAVEFLITASAAYFRPHAPSEYGAYDPVRLDAWQSATTQWLQGEYGDRIVRAELHLDEATPHIHAYLVPLDERGQLNCREIFGQRKHLFALQDSYAAAMQPLGIERGARNSQAKHTDVRKYYTDVNEYVGGDGASLQAENAQLKQQIAAVTTERDELSVALTQLSAAPQRKNRPPVKKRDLGGLG